MSSEMQAKYHLRGSAKNVMKNRVKTECGLLRARQRHDTCLQGRDLDENMDDIGLNMIAQFENEIDARSTSQERSGQMIPTNVGGFIETRRDEAH